MAVRSRAPVGSDSRDAGPRPGHASEDASGARRTRPPRRLLLRVLLVAAMIAATVNTWTGGPLLALWVGSKVQGQYTTLKMGAVGATVLTLAVILFLLGQLITRLDLRYGEVTGRPPRTRQPLPWLRSLRDQYGDPPPEVEPLTALEWILVSMVVFVVGCFEVWFFFFAGSSLPHG